MADRSNNGRRQSLNMFKSVTLRTALPPGPKERWTEVFSYIQRSHVLLARPESHCAVIEELSWVSEQGQIAEVRERDYDR